MTMSEIQNTKQYRICKRCVMDTSDCEITFDENGYCNHCNNYFNNIVNLGYKGEQSDNEFKNLIETIKAKGINRKYDCVIGVSGGIDSSYVAYLAKENGLRALLVHIDNGWDSPTSYDNVNALASKLGFDCEAFKVDFEEFKKIQLAFLKASTPDIEAPTDMALQAILHNYAKKYGVKYIISGGNFATEGILPNSWFYNAKDITYLKAIIKQYCSIKPKHLPFFGWKEEAWCKVVKGIKTVYFLNLVPFSKDNAKKILEDKLDWKYYGGKHYESKYTGFEQAYILPKKFNIDYRRATFSTQICAGTMTREQAIAELENLPYDESTIPAEKQEICNTLGITVEEFDGILAEKPKYYWDYPNDEKKLEFIYNVYRKLTGKKDYRK